MRKTNKDITTPESIETLLHKGTACRIGLCHNNMPYVVPMNYAHEGTTVYLHCASKGKRYDILRNNPNICFELDFEGGFMPSQAPENACKSDYAFQSLIADGVVEFVDSPDKKLHALNAICKKYFGRDMPMASEHIKGTVVLAVNLQNISVKQSGEW